VSITVTAVNDAPVAADDAASVDEDGEVLIDIVANDSDRDGDPLTVTVTQPPSNGTLADSSGYARYTPNADFHGSDAFSYAVSDPSGAADTATVSITVNALNDVPVAVDDSATVAEDSTVNVFVLTNDSDADGDAVVVDSYGQGSNGTVSLVRSELRYEPAADFNGTDSFRYGIRDGNGGLDTATVFVTVTAVADPPAAADDAASVDEDAAVAVPVLANDSDPDGGSLAVSGFTNGANGTVAQSGDTLTYTPAADYSGTDTFTYDVTGAGGTSTATVTVTVNPINDAPVAVDDAATIPEDSSVNVFVLANDTDADGDSVLINSYTQPTHGTVTAVRSELRYEPDADWSGIDSFTYEIRDGNGGTATATVSITVTAVNDAPVAADDAASVDEDGSTAITVLTNDTDADGDALSVSGFTAPANGSVTQNGDTLTYTPNPDYSGSDSFSYDATDGTSTATATVTVTVNAVNDAPVAAEDTATTAEDAPVTLSVLANDADADGDALAIDSVRSVVGPIGVKRLDADQDRATVTTDGTTVTYSPNPDWSGADDFVYYIGDGAGGADSAIVSMTVTPVNDAPVATADADSTIEEWGVDIDVLGNDSDPEFDALSVTSFTQPSNGSVATTDTVGDPVTGLFYLPAQDFAGTDTFTYTVADDSGATATTTVTVSVRGMNDAPVAADDSAATNEDASVLIDVLANDSDVEGDSLTVSPNAPANGTAEVSSGQVRYTPAPDYTGTESFTYTVNDGNGGTATATVSVTVNPVADAPVANDDSKTTDEDRPVTVAVKANDTDADGDTLIIESYTQPANGSVTTTNDTSSVDGLYYVPSADFNGTDTFDYTVSDGTGRTATATVTLTVNAVNDAPVTVPDTMTSVEDDTLVIDVLANDTDPEGQTLTVVDVHDPGANAMTGEPDPGTTSHNGSQVTFAPTPQWYGTTTFWYQVSDGTDTVTDSITVTLTSVNDPVVGQADSISGDEDSNASVMKDNLLENDSDADGDTLTMTGWTDGSYGTVTENTTYSYALDYTPQADWYGTDTFEYYVSDGNGSVDTVTVHVTVNPVNDAPTAGDDSGSVDEDQSVLLSVLANDSDIDGDAVSISSFTQGTEGAVTQEGNDLRYTPNADFNGSDAFTYDIADGNGGTATATVSVTINPVSDAPVATDDTPSVDEDGSVLISVLANDSDADGDSLSITGFTSATDGTVTQEGDQLRYTPHADFNGSDAFTYDISDGTGGIATATVTVTVNAINDVPTATADTDTVPEDGTLLVSVLANDSDVDGDAVSISSFTQGTEGAVTQEGNDLRYTPNADFNGSDAFTYDIADGNGGTATATVSVTVSAVNDAPSINDDAASVNEDDYVVISVLANDSDADGDALSITGFTQGTHGSTSQGGSDLYYSPNNDFNGTDSFTYTATDGTDTLTATVSVTVNPVSDAPTANDDTGSVGEDGTLLMSVLANDTDVDGDAVSISSFTQGSNGTVTQEGDQLRYTPDADFFGTDSFTYTVSDGNGGTASATVSMTVNAVNDAPTAGDDTGSVDEDDTVLLSVLANDSDVDGDAVSISSFTQATNGTVTQEGGQLRYTPHNDFNGSDSFAYDIADGNGGTATGTVSVTVNAVNDAPTANDDTGSVDEDDTVLLSVLANDGDPDGDVLSVSGYTAPTNGTVGQEGDQLRYTPDADYNGSDSFTYDISDGNGGIATATVTMTINAVNDAPVAGADEATAVEDSSVWIEPLTNDYDPEGSTVSISSYMTPENGTIAGASGQTYEYVPNPDFYGTDTWQYVITDGAALDTGTVTITVTAVADSPVAVSDSATVPHGGTGPIYVVANDYDPDGDALTVTNTTGSRPHGTVAIVGDTLFYTMSDNYLGWDAFPYWISDGTTEVQSHVDVNVTHEVDYSEASGTTGLIQFTMDASGYYDIVTSFYLTDSDTWITLRDKNGNIKATGDNENGLYAEIRDVYLDPMLAPYTVEVEEVSGGHLYTHLKMEKVSN
jgi:hypothetical protein